jgi:AAA family ATPase
MLSRARQSSPAVIFFDELDGMVMSRDDGGDGGVSVGDRMLSTLLQEMDGLQVSHDHTLPV